MTDERPGFATEQVHGGFLPDTAHGARVPAIHMSSGFLFEDAAQARDRFAGTDDGYTYTRLGNPTNADVERRIALLERGADALLVSSGQAAATVAFLGLLAAGDHVVSAASIYEGTRGLLLQNLGRLGIHVDFVTDARDLDAWAAAVRPETKLFFAETIPNPKNDVLDIAGVAEVAHRAGVPLVVDNTLATPYLVQPVEHGADVVVHSASKFLSGHGSGLGGVVVDGGRFDWTATPERWPHLTQPDRALGGASYVDRAGTGAFLAYARDVVASRIGPTPSPFNAFLLRQGIETLSLRVERHVDERADGRDVAGGAARGDERRPRGSGLQSVPRPRPALPAPWRRVRLRVHVRRRRAGRPRVHRRGRAVQPDDPPGRRAVAGAAPRDDHPCRADGRRTGRARHR